MPVSGQQTLCQFNYLQQTRTNPKPTPIPWLGPRFQRIRAHEQQPGTPIEQSMATPAQAPALLMGSLYVYTLAGLFFCFLKDVICTVKHLCSGKESALPLFNQHMVLCALLQCKKNTQTHSVWFCIYIVNNGKARCGKTVSFILFLHFDFQKRLLDRKHCEEKPKAEAHKLKHFPAGRAWPSFCSTCKELSKRAATEQQN